MRNPCYETQKEDGKLKASLRPIVVKWMDHIAMEPICEEGTVLGALLSLIRTRLLIIEPSPDIGQTASPEVPSSEDNLPGMASSLTAKSPEIVVTTDENQNSDSHGSASEDVFRAKSTELVERLKYILNKANNSQEDFQRKVIRSLPKRAPQDLSGHLMARAPTTGYTQTLGGGNWRSSKMKDGTEVVSQNIHNLAYSLNSIEAVN